MSQADNAVFRLIITVFISMLLMSACTTGDSQSPADSEATEGSSGGAVASDEATGGTDAPSMQGSTRVSFNITVPKYVSNALQVQLVWGQTELYANWVTDESWTITHDLPKNTEHHLMVTFFDDNGAIPLARFETPYTTGSGGVESYQINAEQFDTNQWDHDNDGVSNLDELIAGTYLLSDDASDSVRASLELIADKTLRIRWQPSF